MVKRLRNIKNIYAIGAILTLLIMATFSTVNAIKIEYYQEDVLNSYNNDISKKTDYIDISVEEAWDLLTSTENGMQIPIDARSFPEFFSERIDTPYPEDPKQHSDFTDDGVQEFISIYDSEEVVLYCRSGGRSQSAAKILVNNEFNGVIYNMVGGISAWEAADYPTKHFNDPPETPDTPSGPIIGSIGSSYTYSTITADDDDDSVKYGWSWDGDNIVDEWTSYYPSETTVEVVHSWINPGTYEVLVKAEDNVGEQSDFSSVLTVIITNPPNPPAIDGPTKGNPEQTYEYIFSAVDPDNDDIYLYIDWGDNNVDEWIGPYTSGEEVKLNHMYSDEGTYEISAKSKDIYDFESDWSYLEVTMPRIKNKIFIPRFNILLPILLNFFDC